MQGVLNVRDPITIGGITYPGAAGDGCTDDTEAIQRCLDALYRFSATAASCFADPPGWPEYASALYFPAGFYRITARLRVPYLTNFRLFGEAAGALVSDPLVSSGAFIRQDTPDEPILVFGDVDVVGNVFVSGWSIDGLGFTWAEQQEAPKGWVLNTPDPEYVDPGAVAILFTGPCVLNSSGKPVYYNADFYHGRITRCRFERGWRGIAIDDTARAGAKIAVWNVAVEGCQFSSFRGAAVSYVNGPNQAIGMPNNSIVNTFVENYVPPVGIDRSFNVEYQIRVSAQSAMRMASVDLEGSRFDVLYADNCNLVIDGLHIENIRVERVYGRLMFLGGGLYRLSGVDIDGVMIAQDPEDPDDPTKPRPIGVSTIISAGLDTVVTLSGVRMTPHDPQDADPDTGGFIPLRGDAYLLQGGDTTGGQPSSFHLLDRPQMPVYSAQERAAWPGTLANGAYKEISVYPAVFGNTPMAPLVQMPPVKASVTLTLPTIAAGGNGYHVAPVAGARPGDMVQTGLPQNFPKLLILSAVAQPDAVELIFANPRSAAHPGGTTVTILLTVGGGPLAGGPQPPP